jgi:hypothetical protein
MTTKKQDVLEKVTDQIMKGIEDGAESYRMPWRTSGGFVSPSINQCGIEEALLRDQYPCSLGNRPRAGLHLRCCAPRSLAQFFISAPRGRLQSKQGLMSLLRGWKVEPLDEPLAVVALAKFQ